MSAIEDWIRSKVGCGYVYGATGWVCSSKRRNQQATQYPKYAENILGICAKWDGKECYDCAQLIRKALESIGVTGVPSGATSQWNKKSLWSEYGAISTLPSDGLAVLWRAADGAMQHVGWRMSDGSVIDARSSDKGVIISSVGSYKWTHWARPIIRSSDTEPERNDTEMLYKAVVTTESGSLNVRNAAKTGSVIGRVPKNAIVEVLTEPTDGWCRIRYNDLVGYASADFLTEVDESPTDIKTTTLVSDDGLKFVLMGNWRVMADA